jgi:hypothetical protein
MIRADQIPDEVVKLALSAYKHASSDVYTTEEHDMAEALVAALNAWPGAHKMGNGVPWSDKPLRCILPLPQEKE